MQEHTASSFSCHYTKKDAILYALSLGFGSDPDAYAQELPYVFEHHPDFDIVPTWVVAFTFRALPNNNNDKDNIITNVDSIPAFPPPFMKAMGIIPQECLKHGVSTMDLDAFPVLHTWQSITWHRTIPIPRTSSQVVHISGKFLSVVPKSIGSFVTTETSISLLQSNPQPLCTLVSTCLILGLDKHKVIPFQDEKYFRTANKRPTRNLSVPPDCIISFPVPSNQALLYRMASGDSNRIHVHPDATLQLDRPLLHGLCTLGMVVRAMARCMDHDIVMQHMQGRFTQPVYMNDVLQISLWIVPTCDNCKEIRFQVKSSNTDSVVLDEGYARVQLVQKDSTTITTNHNNTQPTLRSHL
jgi:acyl dehydratase